MRLGFFLKLRGNLPDLHEIVLTQATLTKHIPGHFTGNESITLGIPSPEDLIVILLLLTRESPRNLGSVDRRVLQKRLESLLKRLRRLGKLGNPGRKRLRSVSGCEYAGSKLTYL